MLVKTLHSLAWTVFAGCIVAMPLASATSNHHLAAGLALIVLAEVVVLLVNRWRCPLTALAAKYTDDRSANFDIFLPRWLAQHNKQVFGTLYVAGLVYGVVAWRLA